MAVRPIYNSFHPILNKPTNFIDNIDGKIFQIGMDLQDTLKAISNGVGLAGNQIGIDKSIILIDVTQVEEYKNAQPIIMINPEILEFSDDLTDYQEGCLSVPDLYEDVKRPSQIKVKYYDFNQKEIIKDLDGFLARVVQHEVDHLNGILFYQRFSPLKKTLNKNKLNKIKNGKLLPEYQFVLPDGKLV